jgi:hypothetical protein
LLGGGWTDFVEAEFDTRLAEFQSRLEEEARRRESVREAHKTDGIYRATLRGDSTHTRSRVEALVAELMNGGVRVEPGRSKLTTTRSAVEHGWRAVSEMLRAQNHPKLAAGVLRFVDHMPPPRTEKEQLAAALLSRARARKNIMMHERAR